MAKNQKNQGFAAIRDVVSSSRFRESRMLIGRDEYILQQTSEATFVETEGLQHEKNVQGKVKRYGKYTVKSTFTGNCSITDVMNCYIERKASLKYQ